MGFAGRIRPTTPTTAAAARPAPVELVKLQLHRQAECKVVSPADQYVRIKCAPVSSAVPAPQRVPALAAISLACLPWMKTFLAPFEQTAPCTRPADHGSPPTRLLLSGMACWILGRAHGR